MVVIFGFYENLSLLIMVAALVKKATLFIFLFSIYHLLKSAEYVKQSAKLLHVV